MVYINEWMPNPVGADAAGEFIELYNSGALPVSLNGYTLSVGGKKRTPLAGRTIAAGGYLVLKKADTKLSLKNTDGALFLYGPDGRLADQASFEGSAPEGKSFSRVDYRASTAGHFAFTDPTPGKGNASVGTMVAAKQYSEGMSLAPQLPTSSFFLLMLGTAFTVVFVFTYILAKNEDLSHYLFGNDAARR